MNKHQASFLRLYNLILVVHPYWRLVH